MPAVNFHTPLAPPVKGGEFVLWIIDPPQFGAYALQGEGRACPVLDTGVGVECWLQR